MSANIVFVQGATTQQGTLDSGVISVLVTLSNFSNTGVLAWRWTMVDKPEGSAATLSTPSAETCTFTPDIPGTYLIQLRTYSDATANTLDAADQQALGVPFLAPNAWRLPAAGESREFGDRGWAKEVNSILSDVRTALNNGAGPDLIEELTSAHFSAPVHVPTSDTLGSGVVSDETGDVRPIVRVATTGLVTAAGGVAFYKITPTAPLPDRFTLSFYFAVTPGTTTVGSPLLSFGFLNDDVPDSYLYVGGILSPQGFISTQEGVGPEQFYLGGDSVIVEGQLDVDFESLDLDAIDTAPRAMISWTGRGNVADTSPSPYTVLVDANGTENQQVTAKVGSIAFAARTAQKASGWDAGWDGKSIKQLAIGVQSLVAGTLTVSYDLLGLRLLKHPMDR